MNPDDITDLITTSSRSSGGPTLAGRTILIVEDHPDSRDLLTAVLQTLGARVFTADSVQEAERQLALLRPDLIVCDMHLPDGTGLDFITWLRAKRAARRRTIPCIAITGYAERFPPNLAQGFDAYMRKPLDLEKFCSVAVAVARASQDSTRRVVLIVEGELPVLGLLRETLGRLGYDTHLAITATDAVRLAQLTRPDVRWSDPGRGRDVSTHDRRGQDAASALT
jgi:CheY-like chemotaxis protein